MNVGALDFDVKQIESGKYRLLVYARPYSNETVTTAGELRALANYLMKCVSENESRESA